MTSHRELNQRAFCALDPLANVGQPPVKLELLRHMRADLKEPGGFPQFLSVWRRFLGLGAPPPPKAKAGRKPLAIPVKNICDALRTSNNVHDAAAALGCSRGYLYKCLGKEEIKRLLKKGVDHV